MREWSGIRDDLTQVTPDIMAVVVGGAFIVDNELQRRTGLTALTATGGIALGHFKSAVNGSWLLICTAAGNIESVAL